MPTSVRSSPRPASANDRLADVTRAVRGLDGWRRAAVAAAAGLVSVLALAPFFLWPILFLTLPVLVWLIDGAGDASSRAGAVRRAAWAGWWFAFGYFFAGLFWIGEAFLVEAETFGWALPFAVTLMPAGLALFWAAAAAAARLAWPSGVARVLVLAITLGLAEWLRGHVLTGFPWNVIGYALTPPGVLMQSAGLLGIYALSMWAVVIFAAPLVVAADAIESRRGRLAVAAGGVGAAAALACLAIYGAWAMSAGPAATLPGINVRIVQPSVPQREKWRPENQRAIFADHLALSAENAQGQRDGLAGITHVVWPEAAMPFLPLEHPEALAAIGEMLPDGVVLITGALRREAAAEPDRSAGQGGAPALRRAFNSLMAFDTTGQLVGLYDKAHLVPFGEYLPLQPVLEAIGLQQLTRMRGGFTEGPLPRPTFSVAGLPQALPLICYEAIFPEAVTTGATARGGVLVNVTNDGWFGNTTGPRQHFHQARVRAVETGLPLIRAANNGISAAVDPFGRVIARLDLDVRGVIDVALPAPAGPPLVARLGDLLVLINALILGALAAGLRIRRNTQAEPSLDP